MCTNMEFCAVLTKSRFLQVTGGCGRVLVLAVGVNSEWGKTMAMCQIT